MSSKKNNIMLVNLNNISAGSAEMRGTKIINTLNKKHNVIVATSMGTYPVEIPTEIFKLVKINLPILKYFSILFTLFSLVVNRKIDIIIAENYRSSVFCLLVSKIKKTIVISDYHGVWVDEHIHRKDMAENTLYEKILRLIDKWIQKNSDYILTVSNNMNKYFTNNNVEREKIHKLYNLIDIEKFSENNFKRIKNEYTKILQDFQGLIIGYFGNFVYWQGIPLLLSAYSKFLSKNQEAKKNTKILLVGGKSPSFNLSDLLAKLELENNVIFIEQVQHEEIPYLMSLADVLALPRPKNIINEVAFPTKFPEYLMMNKAILATNVGDVGEFIEKNNLGYISLPNENSISKLIEKIWKEDNFNLKYKNNSRFAKRMFSSNTSDQELLDFVDKILKKKEEFNFQIWKENTIDRIRSPLFKNAFFLLLGRFANAIFGFLFWFMTARFFTENDVGIITSIFSVIGWVGLISLLGLDDTIRRYAVSNEKNSSKIIWGSIINISIVSLILNSILVLILFFINEYKSIASIYYYDLILIVFGITVSISYILDAIFVSRRKGILVFLRIILTGALKVGLLFAFIFIGIMGPFVALSAAFVPIYIIFLFIVIPKIVLKTKFERKDIFKELNKHRNYSRVNYLANLIGSLPSGLMGMTLVLIGTPDISSYYAIPWSIAALIFAVMTSISTSYLTECVNNKDKKIKLLKQSYKVAFILQTIILIFTILLGRIILGIYGNSYRENSYYLLILFVFAGFFYGFNALMVSLHRFNEKAHYVLIYNSLVVLLTFGIVFITFKYTAQLSVGIGWCVAQIAGSIFNFIIFSKYKKEEIIQKRLYKTIKIDD